MKRQYLTLTIRKLKVKLSHVSRTTFKITRRFFKSRLGIDKRDWSRLTKAEIIRVLNFYYDCVLGRVELVKAALTRYQFKPLEYRTRLADGMNTIQLPKLKPGQLWMARETVEIGEFSDTEISLHYLHFQIAYPPGHQLDIWDNPDCFMVVAKFKNELYGYTSKRRFNVTEIINKIEQHYTSLLNNAISATRHRN